MHETILENSPIQGSDTQPTPKSGHSATSLPDIKMNQPFRKRLAFGCILVMTVALVPQEECWRASGPRGPSA